MTSIRLLKCMNWSIWLTNIRTCHKSSNILFVAVSFDGISSNPGEAVETKFVLGDSQYSTAVHLMLADWP